MRRGPLSFIVNMMRVLFVVPYVPNLIRVRPYNFIRHLARRGHAVTVLTVRTGEEDRADLERLRLEGVEVRAVRVPRWRSALNCLRVLPTTTPLQAAYAWHPELVSEATLRGLDPEVIHVEHLRGAWYGLALKAWRARLGRPVPVIWDSVDSISLLFRHAAAHSGRLISRWITRFELGRTERYEGWLARQFDRVLVTSRGDCEALLDLAARGAPMTGGQGTPDLRVIPNGVDLEYFSVDREIGREPATLVMSGKMSYHANVTMALHFVRAILPLIRVRRPDVKLWIVGKDPTPEIRSLTQDAAITVTGTVADLRPYLRRATAAVAPVAYGVGIQNKVLEAMACGTPVVSTPQSVSALELEAGRDAMVAESPEAFADAVLSLLHDEKRRDEVGRAGRRYVEDHHAWPGITARLEDTYHGIPAYVG